MKERIRNDRSIWTMILLDLITFGFYSFFFYHGIVKDVNTICEEDGKRSPGVFIYIVLTIVSCGIYNIIWWCNMHDRLRAVARSKNIIIDQTTSGLMLLHIGSYFIPILVFVAIHKFLVTLNDMSTAYNQANGHYN